MLIRLAILLTLLLLAISAVMFLLTRDPRYPRFAYQVLRFMIYVLLVFGALWLLERYGLVAWRVFI